MEETGASFLMTLREQTVSGNLSGGVHKMHISLVKVTKSLKRQAVGHMTNLSEKQNAQDLYWIFVFNALRSHDTFGTQKQLSIK